MKRFRFEKPFMALAILALVFGLALVACGNDEGGASGGSGGSISGTYNRMDIPSTMISYITFRTDGTCSANMYGDVYSLRYTRNGSNIILSRDYGYGTNWGIIDSVTLMDGYGGRWRK